MWFRKKPAKTPPAVITTCLGFTRGEVVRHKIDHVRIVIIGFVGDATVDGDVDAKCAFSSRPADWAYFDPYEIERFDEPEAVAAVREETESPVVTIRDEESSSSSSAPDRALLKARAQ